MKHHTLETGNRIGWEKSAAGTWICVVPTLTGERKVDTKMTEKRNATRAALKFKRFVKLEKKFDRRMIGVLSGVRNTSLSKATEKWSASRRRNGTMEDRTVTLYETYLRAFARDMRMEKDPVSIVAEEHVSDWVNGKNAGKASTRKVKLAILTTFFHWCQQSGYMVNNPARSVGRINFSKLTHEQKERTVKERFTDEEIQTLLDFIASEIAKETEALNLIAPECQNRSPKGYDIQARIRQLKFWSAATVIGRYGGLRLGDIASLEKASLQPDVLNVWTDKRDRRVSVPLHPLVSKALRAFGSNDERFFFPIQQALNADTVKRAYLPQQFGKLLRLSKIKNRSFHCLRGTFLCDAVERFMAAGKTREEAVELAAALAGHSTAVSEKHYLNQPL